MGLQQRLGQLPQGDVGFSADDLGQKPDMWGQLACRAGCPALRFGCQTAGLVLAIYQANDRACSNPKNPPRSTPRMPGGNVASDPNTKIKR